MVQRTHVMRHNQDSPFRDRSLITGRGWATKTGEGGGGGGQGKFLPSLYKTGLVNLGAGIVILHLTHRTLSSNQPSYASERRFKSGRRKTFFFTTYKIRSHI